MSDLSLVNERGSRFRPLPIVVSRGLLLAPGGPTRVDLPPGPNGTRFPSQYQLAKTRADATYVIDPRGRSWRPSGARSYIVDNQRLSAFPSQAMQSITLSEGLLEPGSRIAGYVYFSRHVRKRGGLRLDWDARTADGDRVAQLSIDAAVFDVD